MIRKTEETCQNKLSTYIIEKYNKYTMPFKPGTSGNPKGKPAGAKNKIRVDLRETIADFLEDNFVKIQRDFKKLSPRDRLKFYTDLLPYSIPKLQSTTMELTNFEAMSDDQLDYIIEEMKKAAIDAKE